MTEPTADNRPDKSIRPNPVVLAGIERLGFIGYLQEQLEVACDEWDGDMEQAARRRANKEDSRDAKVPQEAGRD